MLIDRTHFHIFPRQEIGALSITLALQYFGGGLVSVFVPILFWKSGFTISSILFFYLPNSVYFILLTFLFLPLIEKLSDKMMMFLSIPPLVFYFLGLKFVAAMPVLFYILPLLLAVNAILFNIGYNIAFSKSSEDGHLGREIGTRDAITSFVQFSAPLIGGLLITSIGFQNTFFIVAAILILSVFPLFAFPRRTLESDGKRIEMLKYLGHASLLPFNFAGIGYAMEVIVGAVLWPLFVYLAVGSVSDLGIVISAGLFAAAIVTLFVGFLADAGRRRMVLAWSAGLYASVYLMRVFAADPTFIVASHVAGGVAYAALMVAWTSEFYKITRAVKDPGAFILSQQMLYQVARIPFILVLMLLASVLSTNGFFMVTFVFTALIVLSYMFANKFHVSTLQKEGI